ncbi:MAG: HI0074 family nucleotidyltransferase substrate-binding subunit [Sphaerochaetaceae bacterium]|jgi:nucleotidyltransferase substrate binding protein (TIGR01987 family)
MNETSHLDSRWTQRLSSFSKALSQLESAVVLSKQRALTQLEQLGLLHTFEFTFELGWETIQEYLKDQGEQNIDSSKESVRRAFTIGLIDNGQQWMNMIGDYNMSSETFNSEVVNNILNTHIYTFKELQQVLSLLLIN